MKHKIKNSDCFDFLKIVKNNSVDFILIDPPYGIKYAEWDNKINYQQLSIEFKRVLKENGNIIIFQGWSEVCETIQIFKKQFF